MRRNTVLVDNKESLKLGVYAPFAEIKPTLSRVPTIMARDDRLPNHKDALLDMRAECLIQRAWPDVKFLMSALAAMHRGTAPF